jgi:hypothetical protein
MDSRAKQNREYATKSVNQITKSNDDHPNKKIKTTLNTNQLGPYNQNGTIQDSSPIHPQQLPKPLPKTIRLLRIPKAGSSSFASVLRNLYNCTSQRYPPGECTTKSARQCPNVEGCAGHDPPPPMHAWSNNATSSSWNEKPPPPMFTMMRHPVARYISSYWYAGHHGKGTYKNITKHTILFPEWDNTMTNYLSGNIVGTWGSPDRNRARHAPPDPSTWLSDDEKEHRLRRAMALIDHVAFVGLIEYWEDSLYLFCRMYICRDFQNLVLEAPRQRNVPAGARKKSNTRPYFDESSMEAVRRSNAHDLKLYQHTFRRFCRDLLQFQNDVKFMAKIKTDTVDQCKQEWRLDGKKYLRFSLSPIENTN